MNRDMERAALYTENSGLPTTAASNQSNRNSLNTLIESADLFSKSLKIGRVRGIVGIINFPDPENRGYSDYVQLTQELIRRDILVIVSCCNTAEINRAEMAGYGLLRSAGDGLAEFCDFTGIEPILSIESTLEVSDIPVLFNELVLRLEVEIVDLPAAVIASERYQNQSEIPGTVFTMQSDPAKTADIIDEYIHDKRLGVAWCDRCGGRFSPFS